MEDTSALEALEDHLREAPIDVTATFEGGGGHPGKQLVVVRGGIGALAKLAHQPNEKTMIRAEGAAYLLARELGWDDLVPVTVVREVRALSGESVEASVQILWPRFEVAAVANTDPLSLPDDDIWRIALFDALIRNGDRHGGNWGMVAGARPGLIDHGHSLFPPLAGVNSPFLAARRNEQIPDELLVRIDTVAERGGGRVQELVDDEPLQQLVERARRFVEDGCLRVDG